MKNRHLISGGEVFVFDSALREPFITALGRQDRSTNVGIRFRLRNGTTGYGEASSSIVLKHLKPERIAQALRVELKRLIGQDVRNLRQIIPRIWKQHSDIIPAAAAMECALTDALTRSFGIKMSEWFGGATNQLNTDLTIPAASATHAARTAQQALRQGFRQLKIKVGTGPKEDWERVSAIWAAIREQKARSRKHMRGRLSQTPLLGQVQLLLDGNQGMTISSAMRLVEQCLKAGVPITLLEQPLRHDQFAAMAKLKRRCPIPLAADESAWSPQDVLRLLDMDAIDVLNVKVAKTGLQASLEIISMAQAAGKRLMIGCMRETAKGLSASVHLACGTGAFDFVDLDSDCLLMPGQPQGDFLRKGSKIISN